MLYIFAMRNALINSPGKARYFVVEPLYDPAVVADVMTTTEIAAPLGRDWHCLKLGFTPTKQIQMSIYRPTSPGGPHDYFQTRIEMPYHQYAYIPHIAAHLAKITGELSDLELPDALQNAFFRKGIGEAYYFWKSNTSVEDWALPQFTPVKQWHEFVSDVFGIDDVTYTENDRGSAVTHFRVEIVIPKPWHKDLKRSMLLWVPCGKTPRRYDISDAKTTDDINEKLKKSGFKIKIPWSFKGNLGKWPFTFLRLYLQ